MSAGAAGKLDRTPASWKRDGRGNPTAGTGSIERSSGVEKRRGARPVPPGLLRAYSALTAARIERVAWLLFSV
jgi:hypothetical protein